MGDGSDGDGALADGLHVDGGLDDDVVQLDFLLGLPSFALWLGFLCGGCGGVFRFLCLKIARICRFLRLVFLILLHLFKHVLVRLNASVAGCRGISVRVARR
jgi:hypothetical protein